MKKIIYWVRDIFIGTRIFYLRTVYKMNISYKSKLSFGARVDKTNGKGVFIEDGAFMAYGSMLLTHDFTRGLYANTVIGENCFVGVNAVIMPGVVIGKQSIVAAGSVVTKDVPAHSVAAGVPAKIIKTGLVTQKHGRIRES